MPDKRIQAWQARGRRFVIDGRALFVIDTGGADKPVLLILHGYPTSSHDFEGVLVELARHFRVIIHDHLGFGLSDKPRDYSYALVEQTDVALKLWQHLKVNQAHVFAHDYGTSIATELLARTNEGSCPIKVLSLTLCNGSVHIELARLRFIQLLLRNPVTGPLVARFSSQRVFDRNMKQLWHDPGKLNRDELDVMWKLLTREKGKSVLHRITRYLRDRVTYWDRWVGALQSSSVPLAFIWGASDPIVGADIARVHHEESPGSKLQILEEAGHYPMLEAPGAWTQALLQILGVG